MSTSSSQPAWISPMKAKLYDEPFSSEEWIFEKKLDGERCIVYKKGGDILLMSRNQKVLNHSYPELIEPLRKLSSKDFIIDTEIVAFNEKGLSDFSKLQPRFGVIDPAEALSKGIDVFVYAFDVLYFNGEDLRNFPLIERKSKLEKFKFNEKVMYLEHYQKDGVKLFEQACKKGWEGLIAKKKNSQYVEKRSSSWLKLKCITEQEFVIGGYTDPQGSRKYFGAVLIGYYEGQELKFAGKVGTGFDSALLEKYYNLFKELETDKRPFADYDGQRQGVHWLKPELICQVEFTEWTNANKLRHPSFKGLRRDKSSKSIIKEVPMEDKKKNVTVPTSKGEVDISHPDKVYFPAAKATKLDAVEYYLKISEIMLPHVKGRPVSLHRFPNGVGKEGFYQKDIKNDVPDYINLVKTEKEDGFNEQASIENDATLAYLTNLGTITYHPWLSCKNDLDKPDKIVFDLDPPSVEEFDKVVLAAKMLREIIEAIDLVPFIMLTGSKGLHVSVPIKPELDFEEVKDRTQDITRCMAGKFPEMFTTEIRKNKRGDRLFLDTLRNEYAQTSVAPYSLRAKTDASIAVPIEWDELNENLASNKYNLSNIFRRVGQVGDPWKDFFKHSKSLKKAGPKLKRILEEVCPA